MLPYRVAVAQSQPATEDSAANAKLLSYIGSAWDTLSRSMNECSSLTDPKVTTPPVVYLPYASPTPPALDALRQQCHVDIRHLPRHIVHIDDVRDEELPVEGLLYLPNTYVVPGGRFNEMYGWDSYFILLGLLRDHRLDLFRGIVENFLFEIENYGALLNANRTYYLSRSQPPFLSSMIRAVYEASPPGSPAHSQAWLSRAYDDATRDYALWTSPKHRAGDTGLARYHDLGEGPVHEMSDDSSYYPDVIRWLLAHPDVHTDYLVAAPETPTPAQAATLARTSCDTTASVVCAHAYVNGYRLSRSFYDGDRAMRESGFDPSFRFGPFSGSTEDYAPVCLNSLLYKYERDMAHLATLLGKTSDAVLWNRRAVERRAAINRYLWSPAHGLFYDYDFTTHRQSTYNYITAYYPLWAGLATPRQARLLEQHLALFEHPGGLAMSDHDSGTQWDLPFGWAPTQWLAIDGLAQYGDTSDATRLASEFSSTVLQGFLRDGTIREKYDVVNGSSQVKIATGYKTNEVGFGWTNGVYLRLNDLIHQAPTHKPRLRDR